MPRSTNELCLVTTLERNYLLEMTQISEAKTNSMTNFLTTQPEHLFMRESFVAGSLSDDSWKYPRKLRLNASFLDIAQVCYEMRESVPGTKQNPKMSRQEMNSVVECVA
jgi:hypothetical protein